MTEDEVKTEKVAIDEKKLPQKQSPVYGTANTVDTSNTT